MATVTELTDQIISDFERIGVVQGPKKQFGFIRLSGKGIIISREDGLDTKIPRSKIEKAVKAVKSNHSIYNSEPSSLRSYGITHINSPIHALIRILPVESYYRDLNMDRTNLIKAGFNGFVNLLHLDTSLVPYTGGVYVVLYEIDQIEFMNTSVGGHFKKRNPTVAIDVLKEKWVSGTSIVYIGKATSLSRRIRQLIRFGKGKPVGHWGGRYLWQLKGYDNAIIAWLEDDSKTPFQLEAVWMDSFFSEYGKWPYANISAPTRK